MTFPVLFFTQLTAFKRHYVQIFYTIFYPNRMTDAKNITRISPQLSNDVVADARIVCNRASVIGDRKETPCIFVISYINREFANKEG
jgi:hypothetical protein